MSGFLRPRPANGAWNAGRWALVAALSLGAQISAAQPDATTPVEAASSVGVRSALTPALVDIPMKGAGTFGGDVNMITQVFKPQGDGPFPVLLFSHGRAGTDADRSKLTRPIPSDQARYWVNRGFAVVAPIRAGYGATGGPDAEANGVRFDSEGRCKGRPDFRGQADAARQAVMGALNWIRAQPWADSRQIVLEGQSVGGLATVAAAAQRPDGVVGYINFAGGAGGNPERSPGRGCDPDQLTALYSEYGRTTTIPNLWIYAENDQYWGADSPKAWHAGFAKGTSRTTFVQAPAVADGDGHGLARHAPRLWARYLDDFMASLR